MDAHKLWMLRDFIGTNKVLFRIPVYQRNYDWSEFNCRRLLDDVYEIVRTDDKHFLGTIVYMEAKNGGFALRECIVIDGQQRLTTLMLMLKALATVARSVGDECWQEIESQYLHNSYCKEEFKIKLKPVKSDSEQFRLLLEDRVGEMDRDTHIFMNYELCRERFVQWNERGVSPSQVLDALTKLEVVEIVLTKGEDDPQVIFESINSTGLDLSNADLIRNYLLMNADDQERLYESYWLPIERRLRNKTDYSNLDGFFQQYLVCKTARPVTSRRLYTDSVKLFAASESKEEVLKELKYYAEIYAALVYGSDAYSERVNRLLKSLRVLNQTTCYPFLMQVFNDCQQRVITETTLERILQLILAYLLRRMVCGVPSNTLRGLFIYLYNRLFKVPSNKNKYYETLNKFLFTVSSKDAMPSAAEFGRALQESNIYGNMALCRFLLLDIENGDRKEVLKPETLTIEHIMPQKPGIEWAHISPEEHERYLHTLGNLSVTGYNSELSNKSFREKQEIIRENTKAMVLNCDVLDKDSWGIAEIRHRAKRLADLVSERYRVDKVEDDSIEFEYAETMTLDDIDEVSGKKLVSFCLFGKTYRQSRYSAMMLDVLKLLDKAAPGRLDDLAARSFSFSLKRARHAHLNTDGVGLRSPMKVKDGVYAEGNLSAWACMRFLDRLLAEYGVDRQEFSIKVIADEPDDGSDGIGE